MSLSLVLNNALSGLRASSSQADLISNNVSNALTEGYGRREISLAAANAGDRGAGVTVAGILRAANPALSEARRFADAAAGEGAEHAEAFARIATAFGEPGATGSLSAAANDLDATLSQAVDTPESAPVLAAAVNAAKDYGSAINRIAAEAMALRTEADASIANQVARINSTLGEIQSLNNDIRTRTLAGADTSALADQREQLIRVISPMIPLKVIQRDFGQVALIAKNGGQLLDGAVFELGFEPTRVVGPGQTLANGGVSGITSNGNSIRIGEGGGLLDGGSLSAAFELRDNIVPEIADGIDAIAADLISRVQGLAADPTIGATDPGLFTDGGSAFDPVNTIGIALRLEVNASVDPSQGGDPAFLRDGLAALVPGDSGENVVIAGLRDAIRAGVAAPSAPNLSGVRDSAGFAAELSATVLADASRFDQEAAFRIGRFDEIANAELEELGVDTDQELSKLLLVEQTFAANARVIQVVDELLGRLTNL